MPGASRKIHLDSLCERDLLTRLDRRGGRRGVVSFARANGQALAIGLHLNLAVLPGGLRIVRGISDEILAAQFVADIHEGLREIIDLVGIKNSTAALIGELLKNFIAALDV
jgi:hypothetical protein